MDTTLHLGDFVYIALIVICFAGASGMASNKIKTLTEHIEVLEKKIDALAGTDSE